MQGCVARCVALLAVLGAGPTVAASEPDPVGNLIDDLLRRALETLRANMSQGFPQWGVPPLDPLVIGDVPLDISNDVLAISGNLSQLVLSDLAGFTIDEIDTNLMLLKAEVALGLPSLTLTGGYALDGVVGQLFPLYGGGPLSLRLTDVPLRISADLGRNGTHYQVEALDFNVSVGQLDLQLHNLFDSEPLATVIDEFADDFGPLLVDILVNDTRRDLIPKIIDLINGLLNAPRLEARQTPAALPPLRATASANEYFDRVLVNVRHLVLDNSLDPIALPDETLELLGTGIKLHDGHLDGLANVHRTGDAVMAYQGEWLGISGHVGFNGLGAGYSCKIEVLHIGPDVTATATISETSVFFAAKVSSKTLEIQLVNFDIENVGKIEVTIDGLGIFDWLLQPLSEAIVNLLKGVVVNLINVVLKPLLSAFLSAIDLMDILEHII